MNTGETGLNLIKAYEGLRMTAYYTPSQEWSIGYGHRNSARHGMNVTEGDALRLLQDDVKPIEALLQETVRAPLNQNEHDALISLIFNIGEKNFRRSSVLRKLNTGDKLGAGAAFEKWTKARVNGELVELDGLIRRRAAEKSLFLMPTDSSVVVPSAEIEPAAECDGPLVSEEELKVSPNLDFQGFKDEKGALLSKDENNARLRALLSASQALSGDPGKMIISKAEELEDTGVTLGASAAFVAALIVTVVSALMMIGLNRPALGRKFGLDLEFFYRFADAAPQWLMLAGGAGCFFTLYILVKRAVRHRLKKQRALEMARVKLSE